MFGLGPEFFLGRIRQKSLEGYRVIDKKVNILDIGCGEGNLAQKLLKRFRNEVTGIDISPENIMSAQKRASRGRFLQMSAEKLDFPNNSFDVVYAMDLLEHVDNLERVIFEVSNILRPGGIFIIQVPAEKSEAWLVKIRPSYFKEIHHVRIFKGDDMEELLKKFSFVKIQKKFKGFADHLLLYYLFTRTADSKTQLSIGNWRSTWGGKIFMALTLYLNGGILDTYLKYVPVWIVTIPAGWVINGVGNLFFPKSVYYEFRKGT